MIRSLLRVFVLQLVVVWGICSAARTSTPYNPPVPATPNSVPVSSGYSRFIQKVYDNADTNKDGSIAFNEAYEMVLRLYIEINRQAPINPPSRAKIQRIFSLSDKNQNNRIQREEFTQLAHLLWERALVRIVTCKVVSLVGAPLVATFLVQKLSKQEWLPELAERIVPEKLFPIVTSPDVARTILIVIFLQTLGKRIMQLVNFLLDCALPKENDD